MKTDKEIREHTTDGIPDEAIIKAKYDYAAYQAKFKSKNKSYTFNLNEIKDKQIIEWLEEQENRSEAIREALREVRT